VDLLPNQTKQVDLLSAPRVPTVRELVVRGGPYDYQGQSHAGWQQLPVVGTLYFANQGDPLGISLPNGVVRVYAQDHRGHAQFIGEDAIAHTPKDETVTLALGESLDVTARRQQTAFSTLAGTGPYHCAHEAAFAIEVTNASAAPVTVTVLEEIPGDWTMVQESHPHSKQASNLAGWEVEIPAEGTLTLTWRVHIRH